VRYYKHRTSGFAPGSEELERGVGILEHQLPETPGPELLARACL
jgi:hypothetical protein